MFSRFIRLRKFSTQSTVDSSMKSVYELATQPLRPISLKNLYDFGAQLSESTLTHSAQWLADELPNRLARQIVALDRMPYGLCLMPSLRNIRAAYLLSFQEISSLPRPNSFEETEHYTRALETIYRRHDGMFHGIARGIFQLTETLADSYSSRDELSAVGAFDEINPALDAFHTRRMGLRMLIGQHNSLMREWNAGDDDSAHVGLISRECRPAEVAQVAADNATVLCRDALGEAPEIIIQGERDLSFRYVSDNLLYVLTELLKNSVRATVETTLAKDPDAPLPPVHVIIAHSRHNEDVALKISDQGGGIPRSELQRIWSYLYTTAEINTKELLEEHLDQAHTSPLAGLGCGLPISRQFARFFGGELQVMSMEGYGTDAYIHLRRLGDKNETIPSAVI